MIDKAKEILKKYFGYDSFRGGQEKVIKSILESKDTFAIMPTGAGKSICYQVPSMLFRGVTLVISPLISLMKDQVDSLTSLGIPATFINSSLSYLEVQNRIRSASRGEYRLMYVAPERLESPDFADLTRELNISFIAIDEAHCVSQWGHDFRPSYRSIPGFINNLKSRPIVAAFTATATENVREDVERLLGLNSTNTFVTGFNRENLSFTVIKHENKMDYLLDYLKNNKNNSGIIYAATRKEVDSLHDKLSKKGFSVGKYHAGMSDNERIQNQEDFIYDNTQIIIATNAFGMGIDKSNVRYVVHYNMPKNIESYYQEAGRAGRDGLPSECILLFSPQDVITQKFLIEQTLFNPERKMGEYRKLQDMVDYCHTTRCLRQYILEYFGEEGVPDTCGNCSSCKDETEVTDITTEAQMVFSCILRMQQRFGTTLVAEVLKGSKNKRVLQSGFDKLSTYGLLKHYDIKGIRDLINIFIAEGYLSLTEGEYPIVKLTQRAGLVLKSEEKVLQRIAKPKEKLEVDDNLFEVLRSIRREIAEAERVPPYVIFGDASLKEMCEFMPLDRTSMRKIKGVGEMKLEKYGDRFIEAIASYVKEHGITVPVMETKADVQEDRSAEEEIKSHVVTYNMFKEGMSLKEIAAARELKEVTLQGHIIKCATEGLEVDWSAFIPSGQEELILNVVKEIGALKLKPIKDALPPEIDYMAIKAVICKHSIA